MKRELVLPILLMIVFAITRFPGLLPENFSAAYAIAFCAGAFFPRKLGLWLPIVTLLITDIALNCYYQFHLGIQCFTGPVLVYMLGNYFGYILLIFVGRKFSKKSSFLQLLGGGIFGAILFYLVTNTLSWLLNPFNNPEYTKNLFGWIWALTKGTTGWPETLTFFRNTLMSGGLFTALFAGIMKLSESSEESEEKSEETEEEPETAPTPDEAKA